MTPDPLHPSGVSGVEPRFFRGSAVGVSGGVSAHVPLNFEPFRVRFHFHMTYRFRSVLLADPVVGYTTTTGGEPRW